MNAARAATAIAALLLSLFAPCRSLGAQGARQLEAAVDSAPRSADRWSRLGDALAIESRDREAVAAYERAMQLGVADRQRAAVAIARCYARLGNHKQVARWLAFAAEAGPRDGTAVRGPAFPDRMTGRRS